MNKILASQYLTPNLNSKVNLNFRIDKKSLNDTFNLIVDSYLNTDIAIGAFGMDVSISKQQDAKIQLQGRQVSCTLPIRIEVSKDIIINKIKGYGSLELNFITDLEIDSVWTFNTNTTLRSYEWIDLPKLNIGSIELNVKKLADEIINRSKSSLEKQIDSSVKEQIDFKGQLIEMLKYVEEPLLIDTLLSTWLTVRPRSIYLSPFENDADFSLGIVSIHGEASISSSKPKLIESHFLPLFRWEPALNDVSHIRTILDVSYDQLNQYFTDNYEGQTIENGNKKITIHRGYIKKEGENLVIVADVSGSINGKLLVSGKPVFDRDSQTFFADDINVDIETKNLVHKTAAWLLKRKIKKKLKNMLRFSIQDNLDQLQDLIDKQVHSYSIKNELELNVDLHNIQIEKFVLDDDRLHAYVTLDLLLQSTIYNINALNDNSYLKLNN